MQEKYNVGIYCRLSRDDERTGESVSIENQKIMLSRYVREQGWNLYAAYCDDGVSGTTFDRPMFNQMIADAKAGKINLILCKDLSRLGRDYIEAGRFTDIVFPSMGCRFIALNDGVDTIHKNNEMLVILKNVMNDLYARDTSSKIRAVKQSTFRTGKYVGCYAPIGYRKSPADKHILEIDPVTAPVVLRIFDMRLQGDSFREIARTLNEEGVPSPRGFYYMAEGRPNLRGETPYWNDVTVKTILRNERVIIEPNQQALVYQAVELIWFTYGSKETTGGDSRTNTNIAAGLVFAGRIIVENRRHPKIDDLCRLSGAWFSIQDILAKLLTGTD